MGRRAAVVMPQTQRLPGEMGEQIRPARLRRHLPSEPVAERAGISRQTVTAVEKGSDGKDSQIEYCHCNQYKEGPIDDI